MAQTYPYLVRRIYNEGHTVGTHTLDHPLLLKRLPLPQVVHEVDGGIATVQAAIGDPKAVAPFFRIPGLARSDAIDSFLASKSLVTWSADVVADDWFRKSLHNRSCNAPYSGSMLRAAASCCYMTSTLRPRWPCRAFLRSLGSRAIR